jgi:hypothetical protein
MPGGGAGLPDIPKGVSEYLSAVLIKLMLLPLSKYKPESVITYKRKELEC